MTHPRDTLRRAKYIARCLARRDVFRRPDVRVPVEHLGADRADWRFQADILSPESVVYSFGVGEDVSFDLELIHRYGLVVHAFDPTPHSIEWISTRSLPDAFVFHPVGLAAYDGVARFHPPDNPTYKSYSLLDADPGARTVEAPVKRLSSIMRDLGHDRIDLLKMDIEGAEYDVLPDVLDAHVPVDQILVEFHHRFPSVGIDATRNALRLLKEHGYRIISVSPSGEEYAFRKQT